MSALIYKIASSLFTLAVLCRIAFLLVRFIKGNLNKYLAYKKARHESSPAFNRLKELKAKKEFEEMMAREKAHRQMVADLHYEYKGFVNLSRIESDRKKLFEDKWSDWKFSKNSQNLPLYLGDLQGQCIKMFGEMSFARMSLIVSHPNFWTDEKENFWRKICHPVVKKVEIRERNLFDTRQRIIAERKFNAD
jgi:hypothetical protein